MLLPLDLATSTVPLSSRHNGLRVEAVLVGRRVAARVTNESKKPIELLLLGHQCVVVPFSATVDGEWRSFPEPMGCPWLRESVEMLAPGAATLVESTTILDGNAHTFSVSYQPSMVDDGLTSPTLKVARLDLDVGLRATPRRGGRVDLELIHRWRGDHSVRFFARWLGACFGPLDQLYVDGTIHSFHDLPCDAPTAPGIEALGPGGQFINRATIRLQAGTHHLRFVYAVTSHDTEMIEKKGNIDEWIGSVESPEVEIRVVR